MMVKISVFCFRFFAFFHFDQAKRSPYYSIKTTIPIYLVFTKNLNYRMPLVLVKFVNNRKQLPKQVSNW